MYNHNQRRFTLFYIAVFLNACLFFIIIYLYLTFSLTFQIYSDLLSLMKNNVTI